MPGVTIRIAPESTTSPIGYETFASVDLHNPTNSIADSARDVAGCPLFEALSLEPILSIHVPQFQRFPPYTKPVL